MASLDCAFFAPMILGFLTSFKMSKDFIIVKDSPE